MKGLRTILRPGPALAAVLFWSAALAWEGPMAASARQSSWLAARQAGGSPGLAQVAGSFRVVAANALWLKVEAYHHEWEERGLNWTENDDLLPLLRTITYLDPHFVEAYGVHGYLLTKQDRHREALAIFQEGVRNNPNSYDLNESLGVFYGWSLKRPAEALPYLRRALAFAPDDFTRQRVARSLRSLSAQVAETERTKSHRASKEKP